MTLTASSAAASESFVLVPEVSSDFMATFSQDTRDPSAAIFERVANSKFADTNQALRATLLGVSTMRHNRQEARQAETGIVLAYEALRRQAAEQGGELPRVKLDVCDMINDDAFAARAILRVETPGISELFAVPVEFSGVEDTIAAVAHERPAAEHMIASMHLALTTALQ